MVVLWDLHAWIDHCAAFHTSQMRSDEERKRENSTQCPSALRRWISAVIRIGAESTADL